MRWSQTVRQIVVCGLAVAVSVALVGCDQAQWDDPEYINKQLMEGDATQRTMAFDKWEEHKDSFDDDQKDKVVPGLTKTYMAGGTNKNPAMKVLVQVRHPDAKEAYLKEVRTGATKYTAAAARALGTIEATDAIPDLLEIYESTKNTDKKQAILQGFAKMPDPRMIGALMDTLELNVDNYPIPLHSYSCDILGDIAQKHPDKFEGDQIKTIVRAQFLVNDKGQSVGRECGLALQKLGEPAVPHLMAVFRGKNQAVLQLMNRFRQDSPKFPPNRPRVGAVQRLVTLRAGDAIDPFVEDLKETRETPDDLPDDKKVLSAYWKYEAQTIREMVLGLGELKAEAGKEVLTDAVLGEMNEAWDEVLDPMLELQLRQDAGKALVRLGDREAVDPLYEMASTGEIKELENRAKALEQAEGRKPMPPLQRYQFNWMTARSWAHLAKGTDEDMEKLDSLIEEAEADEIEKLQKRYEAFRPMLELAKKCMAKDGPEAQGACYAKALESDDKYKRSKAAWEIERLPAKVAGPILTEHVSTKHLNTREIIETALYSNPHEDAIGAIDEVLEEESDETDKRFEMDHSRLKMLRAWLKNNT